MKLGVRFILTLSIFVGVIWLGVRLLTKIFEANHAPVVAQKSGLDDIAVTNILSTLFNDSEIAWDTKDVPPLLDLKTTEKLRAQSTERGIESYLIQVDAHWHWRIYERHGLLYDWRISESPTALSTLQELTPLTTNESFTIAVLIEGNDNHLINKLLQHSAILNFSLRPTSPFTLRNAVQAAAHWREIVLDVRSMTEFSIESIPYTTAVWSTEPLPLPYGVRSIPSDDVQELHLNAPLSFSRNVNIYSIDMNHYSDQQVIEWLDRLPESIQLVRLSHWDIHTL